MGYSDINDVIFMVMSTRSQWDLSSVITNGGRAQGDLSQELEKPACNLIPT